MGRHKKTVKSTEKEPVDTPDLEATKSGQVDVFDNEGTFIRTYSKEVHGSDYKKLADSFKKKIGK